MSLVSDDIKTVLPSEGDILIIHHWDTDGVSSAALISDWLKKTGDYNIEYSVPEVGTFTLQPGENIRIPDKNFSGVFMLDYSVPSDYIKAFSDTVKSPLIIFDHHRRKPVNKDGVIYINPVAFGEKSYLWPSTSYLITSKLTQNLSDYSLLGIAGDCGFRFIDSCIYDFPEVKEYLDRCDSSYSDYIRSASLIDANYKINDKEALVTLAAEIIKVKGNPQEILKRDDWSEKAAMANREVLRFLSEPPDEVIKDGMEIRLISSEMSVISDITRRLASVTRKRYVLVADTGFFSDIAQVYIRRRENTDYPVKEFREIAESLGARTGGKDDVAGVLISKSKLPLLLERVKEYII